MITTITKKFRSTSAVAPTRVQAANFLHLYWDVAWFGVVFGSTLSFLAVFAARLGATGWQLGLLTAGPALVNVLVTWPAGDWLAKHPLGPAVTKTAVYHRLGYFALILVPLILPAGVQVWTVLALTLLMAIPGTALAVGFNALLAATVPLEARGRVVGRRNALLAGSIMVSFLLSGWILDQLSFQWGYAAVFGLGALGAAMSTYHLYRIQVPERTQFQGDPLKDQAQPGRPIGFSGASPHRESVSPRLLLGRRPGLSGITQRITPRYWRMMAAYLLFHFTQFLPAALFPMFWVWELQLSDGQISWINAIFYLSMLVASPLLGPLAHRVGNYQLNRWGAVLLALYPLLTALTTGLPLLILVSLIGGVVWAILSGALANRLLEMTPEDDRPTHLAVYNMALNVATLVGTMLGPLLAAGVGLREALLIVVVLRVGSGLALARWG